jgi:hypothetical protein
MSAQLSKVYYLSGDASDHRKERQSRKTDDEEHVKEGQVPIAWVE